MRNMTGAGRIHFGRRREASPKGDAGAWGAEHFAAPQLSE